MNNLFHLINSIHSMDTKQFYEYISKTCLPQNSIEKEEMDKLIQRDTFEGKINENKSFEQFSATSGANVFNGSWNFNSLLTGIYNKNKEQQEVVKEDDPKVDE